METAEDPVLAALAARIGAQEAQELVRRIDRFSNYPNAVKGMAARPPAAPTEQAALAVVEDPALRTALGLEPPGAALGPSAEFWALLTLAARADLGVLDRVAADLGEHPARQRLLGSIRRAATRPRPPVEPSVQQDTVPQRVSQVGAWSSENPNADPEVLAPFPGQKAAARAAAVRALAALGTPAALEVLARYAADRYPAALLAELHRAWGRFDRREFAARMFDRAPRVLELGLAPTLEGIGGVPHLTGLDVVLTDGADLSPLAECTALRLLRVACEGEPGLRDVEPLRQLPDLTELHLTRTTRHADLTLLAELPVRHLRLHLEGAEASFLLRMPRLERLLVADERPHAGTGATLAALARTGVLVTVYAHQSEGFSDLLGAADLVTVEQNGYVAAVHDQSTVEEVRSRLATNRLP